MSLARVSDKRRLKAQQFRMQISDIPEGVPGLKGAIESS